MAACSFCYFKVGCSELGKVDDDDMYKYVIGKFADPVCAVALGLVSFKYYEMKQSTPSLYELVQKKWGSTE